MNEHKTDKLLTIKVIQNWKSIGVKKVQVNLLIQEYFSLKATVIIQPRNDDDNALDIISIDSAELCEYAICNGDQVFYLYTD